MDERPDLIHDIVVHCIRDDFRVLREYRDVGRPFAAWFYFIARNKILDFIRKSGREVKTVHGAENELEVNINLRPSNPGVSEDNRADLRNILEIVNRCIARLDEKCRMLLRMAGDEFLPREMAKVLGWSADKARKISNDLGYCRTKLANLLFEEGVNIEDILE